MTPGAGPFLASGLLFEQTWQRSTRWCYIPNIKALGLVVSDKKIFSHFPYISYVKHLTPGAEPFLAPGLLFEQTW